MNKVHPNDSSYDNRLMKCLIESGKSAKPERLHRQTIVHKKNGMVVLFVCKAVAVVVVVVVVPVVVVPVVFRAHACVRATNNFKDQKLKMEGANERTDGRTVAVPVGFTLGREEVGVVRGCKGMLTVGIR